MPDAGLVHRRVEHGGPLDRGDRAGPHFLGEVAGDQMPVDLPQQRLLVATACGLDVRAAVWNRHAAGGFAGLGRSPCTRIALRVRSTSGSGIGIADSRVSVYGWSGLS